MKRPNLVGCGAGKSGTTSLFQYLNQHPDIFMTKDKEVHFFSHYFDKGESWYYDHFDDSHNEKVIGEHLIC